MSTNEDIFILLSSKSVIDQGIWLKFSISKSPLHHCEWGMCKNKLKENIKMDIGQIEAKKKKLNWKTKCSLTLGSCSFISQQTNFKQEEQWDQGSSQTSLNFLRQGLCAGLYHSCFPPLIANFKYKTKSCKAWELWNYEMMTMAFSKKVTNTLQDNKIYKTCINLFMLFEQVADIITFRKCWHKVDSYTNCWVVFF